ncbi:MAG: thiamine pyrophosphate-dependent enzyme [Candidatus Bipolaricaulia bacterium]
MKKRLFQGMFHEALNFTAVFNLPVILFVENNQYARFTPVEGHTRLNHLSDRAAGYGVPGITVDGNDVWAVYQAVRAWHDEGPILIEGITYRDWNAHDR